MKVLSEQIQALKWHKSDSLFSWYKTYLEDFQTGRFNIVQPNTGTTASCTAKSKQEQLTPQDVTTIPQELFYPCLLAWLGTDSGRNLQKDIKFSADTKQIIGWRQAVSPIKISAIATEGPDYLVDLKNVQDNYGFDDTYSYSMELLDYEQYVVLVRETVTSVSLSLAAVFLVVIFVTGSLPVTILVVIAVVLVDVFLLGLVHFWDLTMNSIVTVILVIGLGLAVDYSAHIAHTYLVVEAPQDMTKMEQRKYKASVAISSMGSSVFHGGFSTFLAVLSLANAQSYIFVVWFRMFFGIIVFGMANGFILLPVILSFVGPTPDPKAKKEEREKGFVRRRSTLRPEQIAAMAQLHGFKDDGKHEDEKAEKEAVHQVAAMAQLHGFKDDGKHEDEKAEKKAVRPAGTWDFTAGDVEMSKVNVTETPIV